MTRHLLHRCLLPAWSWVICLLYKVATFHRRKQIEWDMQDCMETLYQDYVNPDPPREFWSHPAQYAVARFMRTFRYVKDHWYTYDWTCDPYTYFARNRSGDCDDAAAMAKWAFGVLKVPAHISILYGHSGKPIVHAVCVTDDGVLMVSNGQMAILRQSTSIDDSVLKYFGGVFDEVWNP